LLAFELNTGTAISGGGATSDLPIILSIIVGAFFLLTAPVAYFFRSRWLPRASSAIVFFKGSRSSRRVTITPASESPPAIPITRKRYSTTAVRDYEEEDANDDDRCSSSRNSYRTSLSRKVSSVILGAGVRRGSSLASMDAASETDATLEHGSAWEDNDAAVQSDAAEAIEAVAQRSSAVLGITRAISAPWRRKRPRKKAPPGLPPGCATRSPPMDPQAVELVDVNMQCLFASESGRRRIHRGGAGGAR